MAKTTVSNKPKNLSHSPKIVNEGKNVSFAEGFNERKDEQQLNVWLSKDLIIRLKVKGAESGRSLKDMVSEALNQYLISTN